MRPLLVAALLLLSLPAEVFGWGGPRRLDAAAVLERENGRYLLTRDIEVEGTAFVIRASGVTLDLGGHQVTFRRKEGEEKAHGVLVDGNRLRDIRIQNGRLIQPQEDCRGCTPVHLPRGVERVEIAHLDIRYAGADASAISMHWGGSSHIHHNVIEDRGAAVSNRHQGVAAIEAGRGEGMRIHDNLIRRTRHIGIRSGEQGEIRDNAVFIDSVETNSTGITVKSGIIAGNRVEGEGVHPIGIWPGNDTRVTGNFVRVKSTRAGKEYGSTGAACLRMTWGNDGVETTDNIFILDTQEKGEEKNFVSWGRALWVGLPHEGERALFARNLIVANSRGGSKAAAVAVVCDNASDALVFRENTVIGNWGLVLLADDYGHADGFPRFVENLFVRQGKAPGFRTIFSEYPGRPSTGIFISNRYENGASPEAPALEWHGTGRKELAFGRVRRVVAQDADGRPLEGAEFEFLDPEGHRVYSGTTDASGRLRAEIIDYRLVGVSASPDQPVRAAAAGPVRRDEAPRALRVRKGDIDTRLSLSEEDGDIRRGSWMIRIDKE